LLLFELLNGYKQGVIMLPIILYLPRVLWSGCFPRATW